MRGFEFVVQNFFRVAGRDEEVSVQALEVAFNLLFRDDRLDAVNRSRVALGGETRAALAVQTLQLEVAVVERVDEVRGRPARHAAADGPVIEYDNGLALAREQVRGCHPRYPCADDAHVGARVFRKRGLGRHHSRRHPDGSGLTGVAFQSASP